MKNNLSKKLYDIMNDLIRVENRKESILSVCIQNKLDISLNNYFIQLQALKSELQNRNALNLLKRITKQMRK